MIGDLSHIGRTPQELSDRLWQFAARIPKVVDALPDTRQIVRSGSAAARDGTPLFAV